MHHRADELFADLFRVIALILHRVAQIGHQHHGGKGQYRADSPRLDPGPLPRERIVRRLRYALLLDHVHHGVRGDRLGNHGIHVEHSGQLPERVGRIGSGHAHKEDIRVFHRLCGDSPPEGLLSQRTGGVLQHRRLQKHLGKDLRHLHGRGEVVVIARGAGAGADNQRHGAGVPRRIGPLQHDVGPHHAERERQHEQPHIAQQIAQDRVEIGGHALYIFFCTGHSALSSTTIVSTACASLSNASV